MATPIRPRCFLDLQHGTDPIGRVVIELFTDKTPKTCENFRSLCTGSKAAELSYKGSIFHRVIEEFMLQGGDITRGDGKGGISIYGDTFEDENLKWCDLDKEGLVCMANRGKDTNSSQFFITCAPCDHLNGKHTVFGHVVSGLQFVKHLETVKTDSSDKPLVDVIIVHCGELEFRRAPATSKNATDTKPSHRRPRSRSRSVTDTSHHGDSRSRSRSGSRTSKQRSDRRKHEGREGRRKRGRRHSRSRSPQIQEERRQGSASPARLEDVKVTSPSQSPEKQRSPVEHKKPHSSRHHRSRRPYSRSRSRSRDRHRGKRNYEYDSEEERLIRREEEERESVRRQQRQYRSPERDDRYAPRNAESEVKFKGRGSMKYRERSGWGGGYNRFGRLI